MLGIGTKDGAWGFEGIDQVLNQLARAEAQREGRWSPSGQLAAGGAQQLPQPVPLQLTADEANRQLQQMAAGLAAANAELAKLRADGIRPNTSDKPTGVKQ
jgi:hypothetical protein